MLQVRQLLDLTKTPHYITLSRRHQVPLVFLCPKVPPRT